MGREDYKYIVFLHVAFFSALIIEVQAWPKGMASWWWVPFALFCLAQGLRVWSLASLGRFWNTRIIVLPGARVIERGPYRFLRHPNYVVVATEILVLPLIFQAYITAAVFTLLNALVLARRIPMEEKALQEATNYAAVFGGRPRFVPAKGRQFSSF